MERAIIIIVMALTVAGLGQCNKAHAADNTVMIDQIGSGNQTSIAQDGSNNTATVTAGYASDVNYSVFSIVQQGNNKTANIEVKGGINNTASIQQSGAGNHTASIQNFVGSGNNISISQQGDGTHEFNVIAGTGTTNNANTVTATQSGGVGENKSFNLYFNGSTGATANVSQSGTANSGSMTIQCSPGTCGTWSYTRQ
jgi:hypothetical protein